jgi:hypothetical protein
VSLASSILMIRQQIMFFAVRNRSARSGLRSGFHAAFNDLDVLARKRIEAH